MKCRKERVSSIKQNPKESEGNIIYLMNRDCRIDDNWAYNHARNISEEKGVELIIGYYLEVGFLGGGFRQHTFKVEGLQDVERRCQEVGHRFFLWSSGGMKKVSDFCESQDVGTIVTDMSPLNIQRGWLKELSKHFSGNIYEVDAHNCIPVWITSPKREFAARTIRPKIAKLFAEYLEKFPKVLCVEKPVESARIKWGEVLGLMPSSESSYKSSGGYFAGKRLLSEFIKNRLQDYADDRNNPLTFGQSGLSPYLHYGHVSPARVALEVIEKTEHVEKATAIFAKRNAAATDDSVRAFLEELVVRRELADNFCWYSKDYDKVSCFPDWAKRTLNTHKDDSREYIYSKEDFELSKTHDVLWNAAQRELTISGKMHGYVRMYWAKKIMQWTPDMESAMEVAIYLNDRYQMDGRDPNGYTGIAWSLGGVHDRAWFGREIFGTVRYMAESGMKKKFDIKEYIHRWGGQISLL